MKRFVLILLIFIILIVGCQKSSEQRSDSKKETKSLLDMQVTACNTAHEAGTCGTKLAELGIVLKEDCCQILGKCC